MRESAPVSACVGLNVERWRGERGLSRQALASICAQAGYPRIDRNVLHKIESWSDPRRVTVDELVVLAHALGVMVEDLLTNHYDEQGGLYEHYEDPEVPWLSSGSWMGLGANVSRPLRLLELRDKITEQHAETIAAINEIVGGS